MTKSSLLTATAIIALAAGSASMAAQTMSAVPGSRTGTDSRHSRAVAVLYNQNSEGSGYFVNSQIYDLSYTSGVWTTYNDQAADDFVVPKGKTWNITEIDVTGSGSGTPASENVYFYKDKNGHPGKPVKGGSFANLNGAGDPNFAIRLGKGVRLKPGHYWVSVQANCAAFLNCTEWNWETAGRIANEGAVWEQTDNAFNTGCVRWTLLESCFGSAYAGDFLFELKGKQT